MPYDSIIVGGGPAGMFAAYEFAKQKPDMKVLIIEMGNSIKNRQPNEVMSGMGGAGTFSDGKLHFTPVLSHEKMLNHYSIPEYQEILNYVDSIYTDFGVDSKYYPKNMDEAEKLVDEAKRHGIHLFIRKARHVGSDKLPIVVGKFEEFLRSKGIEIKANTTVKDLLMENKEIKGVILENGERIEGKTVLMAPGRIKAKWMQDIAKHYCLGYDYEKVEVGVRVEFPQGVMRKFSEMLYETIFLMHTPTFDDAIRTFCPCPRGMVAAEHYEGYVCVNGHSNSDHKSDNSNFAFVSEIKLTEPVENTIDYAKSIAILSQTIGGGKPILQRLKDLRMGRRSTWKRIQKSYVKPSLTDVTPGDISMALPHRIVTNILEGLDMLDKVMPGLSSGSTLLYAPEIKLRSSKIKTNKFLETNIPNLFVAGDGAGVSGNIVGAAATGIIAAKGILQKLN